MNDQDEGIISNTEQEQSTTETSRQAPKRERRSSHIMEKIKMVFFEKRKSVSIQHNKRNTKSRQRPLSYPNMLSTVETSASGGAASPSNTPLSQTLSRQSTRHAASEEEEDEDIPRPLMMII